MGARYEDHKISGNQLVPRLALVKNFGNLNSKFVYSQAFKVLQFDTIASAENAGTAISEMETTESFEFEISYQVNENLFFSSNFFNMDIENYVGFNPTTISNSTLGDFENYGAELEMRWKSQQFSMNASYSQFKINQTDITAFTVSDDDDAVLGIPNNIFKLSSNYQLSDDLTLVFSGTYIPKRYACVEDINFVCGVPQKQDSEADFKLFIQQDLGSYRYSFGIANIFDSDTLQIQPYRGSQSPIPGLGRRLMFDLRIYF